MARDSKLDTPPDYLRISELFRQDQRDNLTDVSPLATGADCTAWRLGTSTTRYVLRQFDKRSFGKTAPLDIHIRSRLLHSGALVAAPVMASFDFPEERFETPWVIDRYMVGTHPERGEIPPTACFTLGQVLARLHALPVTGWGKPKIAPNGSFQGRETAALPGLQSRFDNPLPQSEAEWLAHPLTRHAPDLAQSLRTPVADIIARLDQSPGVLCHSDLHERQFIVANGDLEALLDFADCTIADPAWDFESLFYFHGEAVLHETLKGYSNPYENLAADARLFSIGIALHHANRARLPGKAHRLEVATRHLAKVMA